jgi:hypothetical protein
MTETTQYYIEVNMLVTAAAGKWPADPPKAGANAAPDRQSPPHAWGPGPWTGSQPEQQ